tara:strand:- start:536 stop:1471 length:936 start_codon:yes stop_codon:yes gene_type:complete
MAYIGPLPAETFTSFATQEFSTSATTSYTLDHAVTNENEIALFINNVRQQPGSGKAYTATGTALTLSAATASTDTMYAVFLGRALQTINPAGGSVGSSQIAAEMITGQTALGATPADTDEFLVSDAGVLKRVDFSHLKSDPTHVLLSTNTISSAVSSVDITSNIDSTYKIYMFDLINIHPGTDNSALRLLFQIGGSFITANHYDYAFHRIQSNNSDSYDYDNDTDGMSLNANLGNAADESISGRIFLHNPSDTTFNTTMLFNLAYFNNNNVFTQTHGGCALDNSGAVTGVRFAFSNGGNLDSGIIKLYGVT